MVALVRLQYSDREDSACMAESGGLTCDGILKQFGVDLELRTCIIGLVITLVVLHVASLGTLVRLRIK